MATVKAKIRKKTGTTWDTIRPETEVAQIVDFAANVPTTLNGLTDVTVASPSNGQVLKYDNGVWKNLDDAGGTVLSVNSATPDSNGNISLTIPDGNDYVAKAGDTMTGALNMGSNDLNFKGSDPGDIVWKNADDAEIHRLWSGSSTLNYRTNAGTSYGLWHAGNLTNLNQLTNGPGYITSADGGNAQTLDSIDSSSFLRSDTSDGFDRIYQNATGVPTNNLGGPSITEMALIEEQFNNKTAFYPIANLKFYTSENGLTWTEYTSFSDDNKRKFLGGDTSSGINIPNATPYFRIEISNNGNYVYLNALYMYWSSNSHSTKVKIRKQRGDGVWSQHTDSDVNVSSWPGHLYLPFNTIPFHPSTSSTGHYRTIHIDFIPTWQTSNPTYSGNAISLYSLQIWGGYPAGRRRIYSIDEYQNVNFPASVRSNGSTLATESFVTSQGYITSADGGNAQTLDSLDSSAFVRSDTADTVVGNHEFYGTDTGGNYYNAPIEIREVNLVTTNQSSSAYAPAIAWHWGGRAQVSMRLLSNGKLTLDGNQTGQILTTTEGTAVNADKLDDIDSGSFLRSDVQDTYTPKRLDISSSGGWDAIGFGNATNLHFNGHNQFWVGAGNGTWFTGTANTKSQASGLAADANVAHDLLITTMQGTSTYDRGITFAVDNTGAGTSGWRLGKWHSGVDASSSMLAVNGQIHAKGGHTDSTDYYADDYSSYYATGNGAWPGDSGWHKASIVAAKAIQIQSGTGSTNTAKPQIQFHQYGYGGPSIEYDGPNKVLALGDNQTAATRTNYVEINTNAITDGILLNYDQVQSQSRPLHLNYSNNQNVYISGYSTSTGNLGIGRTATSKRLDVQGGIYTRGSEYNQFDTWTLLNGYHGIYSSYNGAHFYPNPSSYGSWQVLGQRNGWHGLEFGGPTNGNISLMVSTDSGTTGMHNNSVGWQWRWANGEFYIYSGTYGAGTARTAWHSGNFTPSNYWAKSGSWLGDLGSNGYTREIGLSMTGGSEFVVLSKSGQGSVLVDGHYMSYESNNGFFGSYNSQYGNLTGIRATAADTLNVQQLDGGSAKLTVNGNPVPRVTTQGTTHQAGLNFTISGSTLYISTSLT